MQFKSVIVLSTGALNTALEAAFAASWQFVSMTAMGTTVILQKPL